MSANAKPVNRNLLYDFERRCHLQNYFKIARTNGSDSDTAYFLHAFSLVYTKTTVKDETLQLNENQAYKVIQS